MWTSPIEQITDRTNSRVVEQQRVAVARALVNEPTLILADEPTGNLDSSSAADVLSLLGELHRSGRTVVLITHDTQTAGTAQRVVRIKDGRVQSDEATSTAVSSR